jgi:hypothetical protein
VVRARKIFTHLAVDLVNDLEDLRDVPRRATRELVHVQAVDPIVYYLPGPSVELFALQEEAIQLLAFVAPHQHVSWSIQELRLALAV